MHLLFEDAEGPLSIYCRISSAIRKEINGKNGYDHSSVGNANVAVITQTFQ